MKSIFRLIKINQTLTYYGLDKLVLEGSRYQWLALVNKLFPWNWRATNKQDPAVKMRLALENLGPIFIKFGQALSTRKDLLPDNFAQELAKLQDDCPPFDQEESKSIVEAALKKPVDEAFAEFELEPMASASIAQVHAAKLPTGEEVVVKVVRPEIEKTIAKDIALMYSFARLLEKVIPEARRLRPVEIVAEFEKTLLDEMDMMREASNAALLKRNFANSDLLYVPEVYWSHTNEKVMTMERIYGIRISETEELIKAGIDLTDLSAKGVTIFFTQVFEHNFFHADMHPGNIFVLPDGRYAAIDFGIMGTLTPQDQRYLAENFLAFFNRDYLRVAQLHLESAWVPQDTKVNELEAAIRSVCEPIWDRPLKEISFGLFLMRLFQTARRFGMEVQPQLVLLQKTLLSIEGLGRQLDDELDLWDTAKPFLERWMRRRMGLKALVKTTRANLPIWIEQAPQMPGLVHSALTQLAQPQNNKQELAELKKELEKQRKINYRRSLALLSFMALVVLEFKAIGMPYLAEIQIGIILLIGTLLIKK